jgi:hypothetical protein
MSLRRTLVISLLVAAAPVSLGRAQEVSGPSVKPATSPKQSNVNLKDLPSPPDPPPLPKVAPDLLQSPPKPPAKLPNKKPSAHKKSSAKTAKQP